MAYVLSIVFLNIVSFVDMTVTFLPCTRVFLQRLFRESWKGKTVARIFMNHALSELHATGTILDLGSSNESASYNRFLKYVSPYTITRTDFYKSGEQMVQLDLERPFPLPDHTYTTVTCFNVLEHIFHYENVVKESARVLKPGGTFVGGTPFLVNYHPDPYDYFRYTQESLERIFTSHGFVCDRMISLGWGPLTVVSFFLSAPLPRWLRPLIVLPLVLLDVLVCRLKPSLKGRYALGYAYVFRKEG